MSSISRGSYCGLYIEMKYGKNRQQASQKEFLADMAAAGHFVATCYSAQDAITLIKEYLHLELAEIRGCELFRPNNSIFKEGKAIL